MCDTYEIITVFILYCPMRKSYSQVSNQIETYKLKPSEIPPPIRSQPHPKNDDIRTGGSKMTCLSHFQDGGVDLGSKLRIYVKLSKEKPTSYIDMHIYT